MLRRMVDWIFGYDFFLSYAWKDGRTYAVALAEQLRSDGFEVFLDSESYNTGDHWRPVGRRALARTSQLVLIGTPGALQSGPVREELLAFGPTGRKIVPIAFDGSLRSLDDELRRVVPEDALYIDEPESTLRDGPSPHVVEQLRRGFGAERQNRRRVRFLSWALLFASVLAVTATGAAIAARLAQLDSQSRAWAAQAEVELDRSPALAMLLAAEADDRWGTEQSRASLYTTIARYPIERYLQAPAPIGSVASTSHALWAGDWDGTVWREVGHALEPLVALGRPITAMDVTAAGDRLAVATDDGVLRVMAANEGTVQRSVSPGGRWRELLWLADGTLLGSHDPMGLVTVDLTSGGLQPLETPHTTAPEAIVTDDAGRVFVAGMDRRITALSPTLEPLVSTVSKTAIVSLAVDRGGSVLAVGTHDHGVELWDANTLEPGFAVDAAEGRPFALAFRGTHLLSAGDDGVLVDVDLASPSRAATRIPLHTDAVLDVDATPSGLVWASRSGAVAAVRDATDPSILLEPGPRLQSDWSLWPLPARSEGSRLVVGDQGGQIWLSDRTGAPTLASQASSALVSLVWRDGWYASRADGSVIRWEALGSAPQTLWKQGDPVWLSAGTREVAAIRADGRVGRVDETRIAWLTSLPALGPDPPRAAVLDDTVAVRVGSSLHRVDLDDGTSAPLLELEDYPRSLEADPKRHQWLVTTKGRLSAVGRDGSLRFSTYLAPFLGVVRVVDDLAVVVTGERELTLFSLVERRALGPALRVPEGIVQGLQVADDDAVTVLVTSFSERTYRLRAYRLALSRESWRRHARRTANRAMSDAEASRFGL